MRKIPTNSVCRESPALDGSVGPRLCADTWLHVKRCVLGLLTAFAKPAVVLPSVAIMEVLNFLHTCEGKIKSPFSPFAFAVQ